MVKTLVFILCGVGCLKAYSTSVQVPNSPCYSKNIQKQAEQQNMLRQMRDMRPGANAQVQQYSQQQSNQQMTDWQAKTNALIAPYLSRVSHLQGQVSSCRDESCANALANQVNALSSDVINNLLPQFQALAQSAQQEMANAAKMPLSRLDELYRENSGESLPSSRSQLYFPPLCNGFQPQSAATSSFEMRQLQRPTPSLALKNIREWNDKNSAGLGQWACVGSLAMGNVRCFERQDNPNGNGQSCEKVNGQVTACYDSVALWTPITSTKSKDAANWASWFDRPPKTLRVMAGAVVMEERDTEKVIKEKTKEAQEMKLVAPLLRPQESNAPSKPSVEPPVPRWENWEEKMKSGKGLSSEDMKQMTEGDQLRFRQLLEDTLAKGNKSGMQLVLEDGAAKADQKLDDTAQWTKRNEDNIQSTVELVENIALVTSPLNPALGGSLEAAAKSATVASRMLILRADGSTPTQYALELAVLLGPDQIKKLGSKGLTAATTLAGFSPDDASKIVDKAFTISDYLDKSKIFESRDKK